MKIFIVTSPYHDSEYTEHESIDRIFLTRELAEEYVAYDIGDKRITEYQVNSESLEITRRTQQRIAEGKMRIGKAWSGHKCFIFEDK